MKTSKPYPRRAPSAQRHRDRAGSRWSLCPTAKALPGWQAAGVATVTGGQSSSRKRTLTPRGTIRTADGGQSDQKRWRGIA